MEKKIKFTDIPVVIQAAMDAHEITPQPDLSDILAAERWAETFARQWIEGGTP
jgi:1-deoxy-D-xylulose 5-phosphate reductoisomerase